MYLYAPDLDGIGHKRGWQSDEWVAALERVDAAARALDAALARGTGVVVTADHGMVDVPRHRHVLLTEGDGLVDGVRHIGGEPRMLHLYAEHGAHDERARRVARGGVRRAPGCSRAPRRSTRGCSGPSSDEVRERIGDVLVAPRAGIAYYDDRLADKGAAEDDRPARLAHGRGAHRAAHPARRVRLTRGLQSVLGAGAEDDLVPRRHRRAALAATGLGDREAAS